MIVKNVSSSLIGVWYIFTPWILGLMVNSTEYYTFLILGSIQFIVSLLAIGKFGEKAVLNWVSLLIGVWFIIFPNAFAFNLNLSEIVIIEILGLTTILLNYAVIFPESQ